MKKSLFVFPAIMASLMSACAFAQTSQSPPENKINLAGTWMFQTDSLRQGIRETWFSKNLPETIELPGSMCTNHKGDEITLSTLWTGDIVDSAFYKLPAYASFRKPGNLKVPFWLQPDRYYKGAAWYQKMIEIPSQWATKHIELYLERAHWETTVWVDAEFAGSSNRLGTAQIFDLTKFLKPGKHRITLQVDNAVREINPGPNSHSISDHTQGNWNGLVGRLELRTRPAIQLEEIQIFPDIHKREILVQAKIHADTMKIESAELSFTASALNQPGKPVFSQTKTIQTGDHDMLVSTVCSMGLSARLWDEFEPNLYRLKATLKSGGQLDSAESTFGMREFKTTESQILINGRPSMMRGTLECAAFPKTGYPPTDLKSWMDEFKICKAYGLNHIRFHSWCPPDSAFEAADRTGMYLQIECSSWANQGATIGDGLPLDSFIYKESQSIVEHYGNHPSFCMLAYGNEPAGKLQGDFLRNFVLYWKARDHRRVYTTAAGWPIISESDYNSTPDPRIQRWGEGLGSIINAKLPNSTYDWSNIIAKWHHPTVSHEIGQWCAYPDFAEISQYTGVLRAHNFEIFQQRLSENGLAKWGHDFLMASGTLQTLCYKADIEAALRTKGFGGFQLLGLSDFPGQGTALVGVLNVFWKPKPYVSAAQFSQFCNTVVPLVRMPKFVFLNNETLSVPVEVAQFGKNVLKNVIPVWEISEKGHVIFRGSLPKTSISFGNGIQLGRIEQKLASIKNPAQLNLSVSVGQFQNSWALFVYPAKIPDAVPGVYVCQHLNSAALKLLDQGGKVLLTLKKGTVTPTAGGKIAIGFSSIFWNTAWTHSQAPVTMGILIDPAHPAFSQFPSGKYSNWQWWDAMSHSSPIMLDSVQPGLQPLVRVVDDWVTARSLGLIFECSVGKGKLLVSGIDLLSQSDSRPEARQLLYSLKKYMSGSSFHPGTAIDRKKIEALTGVN